MVLFMLFTVFNMVSLVKKLDFFFYFSQTFVKIVFAMPSNVLVDLCFIYVCRLKSFGTALNLFSSFYSSSPHQSGYTILFTDVDLGLS